MKEKTKVTFQGELQRKSHLLGGGFVVAQIAVTMRNHIKHKSHARFWHKLIQRSVIL